MSILLYSRSVSTSIQDQCIDLPMWHDIAQDAVAEDYIAEDNTGQENVAQDKVAQEIIAQDSVVQDKVYRDYIDQESLDLFHRVFLRDRSRVYAVAPKYETGAVPGFCG